VDPTQEEEIALSLDRGLQLQLPLRRFRGERARSAVLMLHGASASSDTFLVPRGASLVEQLCSQGHDVWLLDWRGGKRVAEDTRFREPRYADSFCMDDVANEDIPAALRQIRTAIGDERPLRVLAHCFGAGCLAMAIAAEQLRPFRVDRVVLLTLGLFYETPWDGFIKADDFVLERVRGTAPGVTAINPRAIVASDPQRPWETPTAWPNEMREAFEAWPRAMLPPCRTDVCERVSFMFGHPYLEANLHEKIHSKDELSQLFGSMPLTLYIHAGQNVRRGFAAPYDAPPGSPDSRRYLRRDGFDALDRVTLITGTENEIWHPDSIHRMHEWLERGTRRNAVKHVLSGYGHQDLLWGKYAQRDVFKLIHQALSG